VLCHLLISDVNYGYRLYAPAIVSTVNNQPITSLLSLVRAVMGCEEDFMEFKLDDSSVIVLQTKTARVCVYVCVYVSEYVRGCVYGDVYVCMCVSIPISTQG
jgi:hypothetical protein